MEWWFNYVLVVWYRFFSVIVHHLLYFHYQNNNITTSKLEINQWIFIRNLSFHRTVHCSSRAECCRLNIFSWWCRQWYMVLSVCCMQLRIRVSRNFHWYLASEAYSGILGWRVAEEKEECVYFFLNSHIHNNYVSKSNWFASHW